MTVVCRYIEGWDHGITPVIAGGGLASGVTGTPTVGTAYARRGGYGLQINPVALADESWDGPTFTTQAVAAASFYVQAKTLDTSSLYDICALQGQAGWGGISVDTSNRWQFITSATTNATTGPAVILNKWTLIELLVNMSANPWTFKWRVDGVDQADPGTWAQAATTFKRISLGCFSPGTRTTEFWFDDVVVFDGASTDVAAIWPVGGYDIEPFTADQTVAPNHQGTLNGWNYSDNDFSSTTGITTATETASRSRVDDLATPDGVQNVSASATGNLRYPVAKPPDNSVPRAVSLHTLSKQSAAGTSNATFRTLDGASTTNHFTGAPAWGTTNTYLYSCMDTKPSGGAWTVAAVQALNFEFASTDGSPSVQLYGFVYQAAFPEFGISPPSIVVPKPAVTRVSRW